MHGNYYEIIAVDYFEARSFRGMKFPQHFNFAVNLEYHGIIGSRFSLNTAFRGILICLFDQNTIIYKFRSFAIVLKIKFFKVGEFPTFQEFREITWNLNTSLNTFLSFYLFYSPLIHKGIKNTRKTSFWFKDFVSFVIWVYNRIYTFQDLTISGVSRSFG